MMVLKILKTLEEYEMLEKVQEVPPEGPVKDYIEKIRNNNDW